jgi:MinD superfamily P-loop ATPase
VVINKATLNSDMVEAIHNLALSENIEVIGEIPFDRRINDALIAGKSIVEYPDSEAAKQVVKIWEELRGRYLN